MAHLQKKVGQNRGQCQACCPFPGKNGLHIYEKTLSLPKNLFILRKTQILPYQCTRKPPEPRLHDEYQYQCTKP